MEKYPCCTTPSSKGDKTKNNSDGSGCSSTSTTLHFWTHLWGLHTAPKTTLILPYCALCPGSEEDILHVFFRCRVATKTWLNSDFSHLVNFFLCQALYKGKGILKHHQESAAAPIGPTRPNVRLPIISTQDRWHWRPDHFGRVRILFTVASMLSHAPEYAETVAIREGLILARKFGYTNYILENDCKVVIDKLLARFGTLVPLGHIHQQILSLIDRQFVILSIERRDNNIPAYLSAAQAVSTYPSNI
ncbi:hypothetical protein M9H77_20937 [Catharanthus roseus]|uniref:Uncharacterized protein n=1 Tax=Catharanthus roseus TaxID=4058 RepID=A0ACC0ALB8_CATRO|nr:hypothetical protein M9H77_20937 [Catharanthus roseus]